MSAEQIERERRHALRILGRMTDQMTIITRRLARAGPSASVPPEAAGADVLLRQARSLRLSLERIETLETTLREQA